MLYYACISIGQTAKKNRILLAIGVYYIYTIIVQVISTVFSVVFSLLSVSGVLDSLLIRISENPFPASDISFLEVPVLSKRFTTFRFVTFE